MCSLKKAPEDPESHEKFKISNLVRLILVSDQPPEGPEKRTSATRPRPPSQNPSCASAILQGLWIQGFYEGGRKKIKISEGEFKGVGGLGGAYRYSAT